MKIREEGVLVEQDSASSIVSHVETTRQELMLEVLNSFLLCDDVPFSRNMLFDSSFFSMSRSRVPIVYAEPSLFCQSVGHLVVKSILLRRVSGSVFTQAEKPSRMDETSSSEPDKISSWEYGRANLLGNVPNCFGGIKWRARAFERG